jgi:predicted acylesterase/phospholipase RssA
MTPETSPSARFGKIALCLSGGGYRAASFALGTIDMLDELGLLNEVKLFSTVSGGTFTGVTYAAWMSEGKTYGQFYSDFYTFLKDTNCVDLALDQIYRTPSPSGAKDVSLIRSAAKVYNDRLFKDRKFEPLMGMAGDDKRFLELIYNATEFRKGNSFRFRASHNPNVNSGNGDFKVANDIAKGILLADIVASSSCFPSAFEPLRFPDDFRWQEGFSGAQAELIKGVHIGENEYESGFEDIHGHCISIPLMDGGVYDNQGISNAVMADSGKDKKPIFDLFMICDTSARSDQMLKDPETDDGSGGLLIAWLFWIAVAVFAIAALSAGALVYWLFAGVDRHTLSWFQIIFQFIVPLTLFVLVLLGFGKLYQLFLKVKVIELSGGTFDLWRNIKKLSLTDFIDMIKARVSSVLTMTSNVFMKRIRQLQFNEIMADTERNYKVAFDLIYDLNPTVDPDKPAIWILDPTLEPTAKLKTISKDAEAIKTTLWFDGVEDMRLLIVCGQCTTVYSLLRHLWWRWYVESDEGTKTDVPKPNTAASPWYDTYQFLPKTCVNLTLAG